MTVSVTLRSQLLNDRIYLNVLVYWYISAPDVTTAWEDNVTKTWKYAAILCKAALNISQLCSSNLRSINQNCQYYGNNT